MRNDATFCRPRFDMKPCSVPPSAHDGVMDTLIRPPERVGHPAVGRDAPRVVRLVCCTHRVCSTPSRHQHLRVCPTPTHYRGQKRGASSIVQGLDRRASRHQHLRVCPTPTRDFTRCVQHTRHTSLTTPRGASRPTAGCPTRSGGREKGGCVRRRPRPRSPRLSPPAPAGAATKFKYI